MERILVTGAGGQLGSELTQALRSKFGIENVVATDIRDSSNSEGPFEILDVMDAEKLQELHYKYGFTQIYHLAAILSAKGENNPTWAWRLNMDSLLNILELGKSKNIKRIFWPSSIAVFGPTTPKQRTPQDTIMDPTTVYGISKLAGERWCNYYFNKYNVDVRSIRYPGLISYKAEPGGGTTDYAIDIFRQAILSGTYDCFLSADTPLPMMYINDAIRATIELMETDAHKLNVRSSYNLNALSFTPKELATAIEKVNPEFKITYSPDSRQEIANSWPASIDDSAAQQDWNWTPEYDIHKLVDEMLNGMHSIIKQAKI